MTATTHTLNTVNGIVPLNEATDDQLFSARAHGWSEYYSSLQHTNQFGQRLRGPRRSYAEEQDYKAYLIASRGIREMEAELVRRGLDPKSRKYTRVSASWNMLQLAALPDSNQP